MINNPASTSTSFSPKLSALQEYYHQTKGNFHKRHKKASDWLSVNALDLHQFRQTSQQVLAAASLAGGVALNQPIDKLAQPHITQLQEKFKDAVPDQEIVEVTLEEWKSVISKMQGYVKQAPGHLPEDEEQYLEQQLTDMLGFEVAAELDGIRLNHSYGIMGGEQHLRRFPTDSLDQHDAYQESGIAPNRGAFGWFTDNGVLTDQAVEREKYYFAVQTLYLPTWNKDHARLKPWFKFRKMIMINPAEEIAVVGVVGDAGPALWVNKQYGGSPEVIREGKVWSRESRGRVILLFVDDPEDKVPLGPIDLKSIAPYIAEAEALPMPEASREEQT